MSEQEEANLHQMELCMLCQKPVDHTYGACIGDMGQYLGLQVPTGEIVTQYMILIVGPALLAHMDTLMMKEDAGLLFYSQTLEQQVKKNKFCLGIGVPTGSNTNYYYALQECQLIAKEQ